MAKRKNSSKTTTESKNSRFRKWSRRLWLLYGCGLVITFLVFLGFSFSDLPSFEELENPDIDYASIVYDRNGNDLGRFYVKNRVAVPYDSLNQHFVDALISTEDVRYFDHSGIDKQALARVAVKTILLSKGSSGGGSTITQQLAKQLYSQRDFTGLNQFSMMLKLVGYKIKEWFTAVKLERRYTKEEIIAMYANEYDFIYGAHGIEAASLTYFGKPQNQLNVEEAAILVGMLKNAVLYNPHKFPENAKNRRNVVLRQMQKNGHLEQEELDSLRQIPLDLSNFERKSHLTGHATYFRASLAEWLKKMVRDRELKNSEGEPLNIYRDGLKIYTTVDLEYQKTLEMAVHQHMPQLQEKFFSHWKGRDIWEYKYDKISPSIKKGHLEQLVQSSKRYRSLLASRFTVPALKVKKEFGFELRDYDLERLQKAESDGNYIDRLLAKDLLTAEKADAYKDLLKDPYWKELKQMWADFQEEVDRQMNEKRKMTVFSYNQAGEKDTVMSPLDSIKYHRMILQIGSLAMDPTTGAIRAWVGGPDHEYFQYDHIHSNRQVGSTFKPFVYATAISYQGFSPCFPVTDAQYTIHPGEGNFNLIESWTPKNATGEYLNKPITLYEALRQSKNTVSVYLMKQLGDVRPVLGLINNMGIDSSQTLSNGRHKIPRQPSIALGAADMTVMEMTGAYGTFANNGKYVEPHFVTHIEDKNGKIIYQNVSQTNIALNRDVNYVMVELLRNVGNVAKYKGNLASDVGGKTGTTNDQTDAWFMGFTPDVVLGTWVGGEDRWVRFRNIALGQGSVMARPVFTSFIKKLEAKAEELPDFDPNRRFIKPENLSIEVDCNEYSDSQSGEDEDRDRQFHIFGQ